MVPGVRKSKYCAGARLLLLSGRRCGTGRTRRIVSIPLLTAGLIRSAVWSLTANLWTIATGAVPFGSSVTRPDFVSARRSRSTDQASASTDDPRSADEDEMRRGNLPSVSRTTGEGPGSGGSGGCRLAGGAAASESDDVARAGVKVYAAEVCAAEVLDPPTSRPRAAEVPREADTDGRREAETDDRREAETDGRREAGVSSAAATEKEEEDDEEGSEDGDGESEGEDWRESSPEEPLIILDWDDTLFPTTPYEELHFRVLIIGRRENLH